MRTKALSTAGKTLIFGLVIKFRVRVRFWQLVVMVRNMVNLLEINISNM